MSVFFFLAFAVNGLHSTRVVSTFGTVEIYSSEYLSTPKFGTSSSGICHAYITISPVFALVNRVSTLIVPLIQSS